MSDYQTTEEILERLESHDIRSTFACVGVAALPGPLPYHHPTQIREIHAAGHEIASHSHKHELIPTLNPTQLLTTCRKSKAALEDCINDDVNGFVPPWNRPFHYPQKLSISSTDFRDGRWQQSIPSLCTALAQCGYRWVRIHFTPFYKQISRKLWPKRRRMVRSSEVGRINNITTLRLSYLGYDQRLIDWITANHRQENLLVIYAHPHGLDHPNSQNRKHLAYFLDWYADHKATYNLAFTTPTTWLIEHESRKS